jgi:hypothetical protein
MKVFEITQINVTGIQQQAKTKAYQDAIAAGKSEAEAQNAEAAAGNLAGADALSKVNINDPSTYVNNPGVSAGPSSEAQRQEWMKDPTQPTAAPTQGAQPAAPAPAPAKTWSNGVLGQGSQGDEVKALQTKLGITADGAYGPATVAAVQALQKKLGVPADGAYGPVTRAAHEKMQGAAPTGTTAPAAPVNVAPPGQPPATAARPELGTRQGATQAIPTTPVDPTNPSGVGAKAELTPDQAAVRKDILSQPTDAAGNTTDATGTIYKRDLDWMKRFGQNGAVSTPAQTQPAPAPAQPAPAPVQTQTAPAPAPAGETGGGASTAYRVRTPKGAAAQNQVRESADDILLKKMLTIAGLR